MCRKRLKEATTYNYMASFTAILNDRKHVYYYNYYHFSLSL